MTLTNLCGFRTGFSPDAFGNPISNTGLLSQTPFLNPCFDNFRGRLTFCDRHAFNSFFAYYREHLRDPFEFSLTRPVFDDFEHWSHSTKSERGSKLRWRYLDTGEVEAFLIISGDSIEVLSLSEQLTFLWAMLYEGNMHCSRVDPKIDDFDKRFNLDEAIQQARRYNFSGARTRKIVESETSTLYLGSRLSEKMLRAYERSDCYRLEIETKDKTARAFLAGLVDLLGGLDSEIPWSQQTEKAHDYIRDFVLSAFDFVDRHKNGHKEKNVDRCSRFAWWQEFLDYASASVLKIFIPFIKPSIERKKAWLLKQVIPSIAQLAIFDSDTFKMIESEALKAIQNFKPRHYRIIDEAYLLVGIPSDSSSIDGDW
jgi:hypothetical protein